MQVLDQIAEDKKLIIAVGYMLRSSPAVVAAKQLMKEVCLASYSVTTQLPLHHSLMAPCRVNAVTHYVCIDIIGC